MARGLPENTPPVTASTVHATAAGARVWPAPLASFAASLLAVAILFAGTFASMARVWAHSDTFTHGFLVLPASLLMVWRSRGELARERPRPAPIFLLAVAAASLAWFMGRVASALILEQFAVVALIAALAATHFGPRVTRRLAFPLAFLLFAVPFGDTFTPRLMDVTAFLATAALRATGLTAVRDGLYITTPTSRWQVVESCSGLHFTVAAVVLATLFARFAFDSQFKRAVFVAMAVVASIVANGLRAYVLILVGDLSDMTRGFGMEHFVYGWIVFVVVMSAYFGVGWVLRDRHPTPERPVDESSARRNAPSARALVATALASIVLAASGPALGGARGAASPVGDVRLEAPTPPAGWSLAAEDPAPWSPSYRGAVATLDQRYASPAGAARLYVAYYVNQTQGRELLHAGNEVVNVNDPKAQVVHVTTRKVPEAGPDFTVRETVMRVPNGERIVWDWYWVADRRTISGVEAKWLQARSRLLGGADHAAAIVVSTTTLESDDARTTLSHLLAGVIPALERELERVEHTPAAR